MTENTISMGQSAEIRTKDAGEKDHWIMGEELTRDIIRKLLNEPSLTLEKISVLAAVSLETVKKIHLIEQLAEIKRKEILEECRAKDYCEDYSMRYTRKYIESYKAGLQDGIELATRGLGGNLLKNA
jgi:hypothetical protein